MISSCSSTRRYHYYFDHHISHVDTIKKIEVSTPAFYASTDPEIEIEIETVQNAAPPVIHVQKQDTISDPVDEKKMKRKRVMAVTGFSSTTLGLGAVALTLYSPVVIPSVIIFLLLLGGVIVSALGIRNDRKPLRRLARIGAWTPIVLIGLFLITELIIFFVEALAPVE